MGRQGSKKQRLRRAHPPSSPFLLQIPSAVFVHHAKQQVVLFTDDMLLNQLRRDGPAIEQSFDKLCSSDLRQLSTEFSRMSALIYSGLATAKQREDRLRLAIGQLLMNGNNSFVAAVATLRMGFVLQPGIILRSLLETISTAIHLLLYPEDLASYQNHTLQSPRTIAAAKRAIPPFGQLYGHFSDNFAHIGLLHKSITPISPFTDRHDGLDVNLTSLRIAIWLMYVTSELVYLDVVETPRYWKKLENGYAFAPDETEREWMRNFWGADGAN